MNNKVIQEGLAFDDVLIVPSYSKVLPCCTIQWKQNTWLKIYYCCTINGIIMLINIKAKRGKV